MGLFSVFKRKRRTQLASFTSYKSTRVSSRKPFVPKITPLNKNSSSVNRNERRQRASKGLILRYLKILAALAAGIGSIYLVFFTSIFEIQSIEVNGEADTAQEQAAIKETLQDFLGDNMVFFDASSQEAALLETYAYLKNIRIDRDFLHTIVVTLETYPSVANVRMEFENGTNQYYVVNEHGFIASIGTNLENLPLIVMDVTGTDMDIPMASEEATPEPAAEPAAEPTDEADEGLEEAVEPVETIEALPEEDTIPDSINEELIPEETLEILLETVNSFEGKFDMEVLEIHYLKRARELHLYTERYFFVWIDLTQDPELQLTKLKKALTEIDIYAAPLEYIDLRISGQNGEKVIYRLLE